MGIKINSIMKISFRHTRVFTFLLTLLLLGGMGNQAWAAFKVTYHILTLPIDNSIYHMKSTFSGQRLEAVRVVDNNATKLRLPADYLSPLANEFRLYDNEKVTKNDAVAMYDYADKNKSRYYSITNVADSLHWGGDVNNNMDVYVTYEYNPDNGIVKLDGSENYNIPISGGFLAFNRGRNNRLAVIPESANRVSAEDLVSEDFVKVDVSNIPGTNITTWWNQNPTPKDAVAGQFHFLFKFEGSDPYNIIIGTAYNKDYTYREKHGSENYIRYKWYKGSHLYRPTSDNNFFLASDDHKQYTETSSAYDPNPKASIGYTEENMSGYFRSKASTDITYNTFALLNSTSESGGYVFMVSRFVNSSGDLSDPSDNKYNFLIRDNNYNNLTYASKTLAEASASYSTDQKIYPIRNVNFKVVTPFGSTITESVKLSDYTIDHDDISVDAIPDELNRKYINYTGRFYSDAAFTHEITKYSQAVGYNIYVGYEVSNTIPFKAIKPALSYTATELKAASWYELTDFESDQTSGKKLKWDGSSVFKNNGGNAVYDKLSEFAFVGDPYELRVVYRNATTDATPYYVGAASVIDGSALGFSETATDGYKWEIPFGENLDRFVLRLFGSDASTPMYWKWDATSAGNNVVLDDNAEPTRIKVMELPKLTFTYNIVDRAGNIAIQGTAEQTIFSNFTGYTSIPEDIRSPFLADEDITFWSNAACSVSMPETPALNLADIYVKYTTTKLVNKSIKLDNTQQFNVKLNGEYIYYNTTANKILSSSTLPGTEEEAIFYLWRLEGSDPYSMKIYNLGKRQYVKGTWPDDTSLSFVDAISDASRFIAMMSNDVGIYEVLAATGTTDYYHIGRPTSIGAETKVYSVNTAGYAHGDKALRFELSGKDPIRYILIDKTGEELLEVSSNNPRLTLPAEYVSPLVETYYYYPTKAKAISALDANIQDPKSEYAITEIVDDTDEFDVATSDNIVWVTYKVNDRVKFNDSNSPYMLKFRNGGSYIMEDGNDKLTGSDIKAMYPYTNGDGNLNIYGERMNEEQMKGGSSTRPRWVWFFDSEHNDPYHVKIHSKNTVKYGNPEESYYTYLQTYAVHFNQSPGTVETVVTGGVLAGIASTPPTEYMILGTAGKFKLLTTNPVPVDLDGSGDTNGAEENVRQYVTSFEQYWKTYNMIKIHVLNINTDAPSESHVVPTDPSSYRETLGTKGWHSYNAIATAIRWNGYNDEGVHKQRVVETLEHWYQTFEMGDGTFDIVSADIPPVLVLLDRHGWEIMRKPLPKFESYPYGDELTALKVYDSPMVKEYKFYNNATKATGCHKYTLRLKGDGTERDQITVNGKQYTSSSLGDLPPRNAEGVIDKTTVSDLYVTYTVKEEYEKSYTYNFTDNGNGSYTESGTPSKFMILQNGRFARDNKGNPNYLSKPIYEASDPVGGNIFDAILSPSKNTTAHVSTAVDTDNNGLIDDINIWYVQPNLNIDKEMGIVWGTSDDITSAEPLSEYGTKKKYKDITGFDPYNIQLKNVGNGKFMTSHMTTTALSGDGAMVGDYTGGNNTITLADWVDVKDADTTKPNEIGGVTVNEGYDHTNLQVTNQTFMAVSDVNGNMQLMPRFDHTLRINVTVGDDSRTTLETPVNHESKARADDNSSMGQQTVLFVRPQVFKYCIIDNEGNEALRYKRAGDYYPAITDHFKSPIAKDFKYYKTAPVYNSETKTLNVSDEITGSFAVAGYTEYEGTVYVRYSYDASADEDGILQGQWFTINLAGKDVLSNGTIGAVVPADGTGVLLFSGSKSDAVPINGSEEKRQWQWKFLAAPIDLSSELHESPDPYAIKIFNRGANYTTNLDLTPNPMAVGIKVNNHDRFSLLSHPSGGYALAVNGLGTAEGYNYTYDFLNGASMTTSTPATTATETNYQRTIVNTFDAATYFSAEPDGVYYLKIYVSNDNWSYKKYTVTSHAPDSGVDITEKEWNGAYRFTTKSNVLSPGSLLVFNNDVTHIYTYKVINNGGSDYVVGNPGYLAVTATQDDATASSNGCAPSLPEAAQTPLLNMDDYLYYGSATLKDGKYTVVPDTKLFTLRGLYLDEVYVRYNKYDVDKTEFKVPNKRNATGGTVAKAEDSQDASMNINGGLPYNIIWYSDNMMKTNDAGTTIEGGGSCELNGTAPYMWRFYGNDPYGIQIKHGSQGKYVDGTETLNESPKNFMLLKKDGYDYGILQETGGTQKLSGHGETTVAGDPTKFIFFGLSSGTLIYHLIIARTCKESEKTSPASDQYVDIDYRTVESGALGKKTIYGTSQRDLAAKNTEGGISGEKYQLGSTLSWGGAPHTYSYNAGTVSMGDNFSVPSVFDRPNCTFDFYIEGIYDETGAAPDDEMNAKYKGLQLSNLMSDEGLIGKMVVVNIVYSFNKDLTTNNGMDFVKSIDDKCWYTFETSDGATPYLAHYTNAWGMQSMAGRETRYTNDYLWTPVGDVYGFKLYNRYMIKNSGAYTKVMTYAGDASANKKIVVAEPGTTVESKEFKAGNEVFELLPGSDNGKFYVHPVVNNSEPQYYVTRNTASGDIDGDESDDLDYTILSETPCDWTFGLDMSLMTPYYERAGYVGGLNEDGVTAYDDAVASGKVMNIQKVVYDDDNIIPFEKGYYRLHNQPGVSGISPVRYASGYLHDIEKTAVGDGIPMHFYSKEGVTGSFNRNDDSNKLGSGFTVTAATRGDIPVPATEYDPSTIFYLDGAVNSSDTDDSVNPRVIMSTQGLYVKGIASDDNSGKAVMTATADDATKFSLIDIGGAVFLITDKLDPGSRKYLNFDQRSNIYDLKFMHNSPTDDAKWCLQPVQKITTEGNGEMPLKISTNNGGDGYYYATFYAPYDVLLPTDGEHTYNAFVCKKWHNEGVHPVPVPAVSTIYAEGKFVPAGTPVILRTNDNSGNMTLTLPSTTVSSPISSDFTGSYLEKLLRVDASHDVYTFGLPFTSEVTIDRATGLITASVPQKADSGVGFYINATQNKENAVSNNEWFRNNRYVLHNKIYYRADNAGTRGIQYVPVLFEAAATDVQGVKDYSEGMLRPGNVYNLQGRCVATEEMVKDGTWKNNLTPGVYIMSGKKIIVK